ncbi:hypothetical protein ACPTFC_34535, partial [Pseudomonas aeruginosa]
MYRSPNARATARRERRAQRRHASGRSFVKSAKDTPAAQAAEPGHAQPVEVAGGGHWWRRLLAFAGPGYLVAVGYMDPGNWATVVAGG